MGTAGIPINQDDSAATIADALRDHRKTVLAATNLSAVYAVAFVIHLSKLHDLLRGVASGPRVLHSLVLIGGVLLVALHGVSDAPESRAATSDDERTPLAFPPGRDLMTARMRPRTG